MLAKNEAANAEENLVPLPVILKRFPVSRASIYEWMKNGTFPKPVKLGVRRVAWRSSDINKWLADREAA